MLKSNTDALNIQISCLINKVQELESEQFENVKNFKKSLLHHEQSCRLEFLEFFSLQNLTPLHWFGEKN
jgi:hypothetical protein